MSNRQKATGITSPSKAAALIGGRYAGPPKVVAWREERRRAQAGHHGVNAWKCDVCGLLTVAIDVDPGVTPMFLGCRRTPDCTGMGTSSGYPSIPVPDRVLEHLDWEWTLPDPGEDLTTGDREWIDDGGLLLRPRTERRSAYLPEGS